MRTMYRPAAETLMVAGLLGWGYVALIAVLRPMPSATTSARCSRCGVTPSGP